MRHRLLALVLALSLAPALAPPTSAAPTVSAPTLAFLSGAKLSSIGIRTRVSWPPASEAVSRYHLQWRVDRGSWKNVKLSSPTARSVNIRLRPWTLNRFRLRAFDSAGNAGSWARTDEQWVSVAQEDEKSITYASTWRLRSDSTASGGAVATSGTAGATATFTFTGTHLAWVAQRAPKRGLAQVHVDGQLLATVDLYASSKLPRRVVFAARWPEEKERSVRVTVAGTSGRPYVDVDAFVSLRAAESALLVGAGDIARCDASDDEATAALIDATTGTVFTLGDHVYPESTPTLFSACYDASWGRFKDRTQPAPGNHDYSTADADAYFDYFGPSAGQRGEGYYAYQAGTWRVYALNSECMYVGGCAAGSAQYEWLQRELTSSAHHCVLAYWHRPRFSSGHHGGSNDMAEITRLLYDSGAEVVLAAHDHNYERLAELDPAGNKDTVRGIRHFVVGTGGGALRAFTKEALPVTVVRNGTTHGVLKLELGPGSYSWQFLPTVEGGFADSGSDTCH